MILTILFELAAIPTEPATGSSAVDFSLLFVKMISALIVSVILAILILRYVLPKLSFTKKFNENKIIKVISRFSLGPKQNLFLVKVKEKGILLGVTDHSITKISDIELNEEEKHS